MTPPKPFFTSEDISDMLGIPKNTIEKWFRDGTLQGQRLGGCWRTGPRRLNEFYRHATGSPRSEIHGKRCSEELNLDA